jgi:hypothetical protein
MAEGGIVKVFQVHDITWMAEKDDPREHTDNGISTLNRQVLIGRTSRT